MSPARSGAEASALAGLLDRPGVRRALAALGRDGEEARLVGGAVRDALMGRSVADVDIAVTLPPEAVMARARREGWKAIPTGLDHGTVTLILEGERLEVTTLRRDVETDGRHATIAHTRDFAEDALRRDFTMNALSLSADGRVHDYATGIADARAGLVRFMGDPETRIREDYLRILRFFRFNASHGSGAPDAAGLAACSALKEGMARLSRERLRQETLKLLAADRAVEAAEAMDGIGLWPLILPGIRCEIAGLRRFAAAEAATGRPADPVLRLAALCEGEGGALQQALALSNADRQRIDSARAAAKALDGDALADAALRRASSPMARRRPRRRAAGGGRWKAAAGRGCGAGGPSRRARGRGPGQSVPQRRRRGTRRPARSAHGPRPARRDGGLARGGPARGRGPSRRAAPPGRRRLRLTRVERGRTVKGRSRGRWRTSDDPSR